MLQLKLNLSHIRAAVCHDPSLEPPALSAVSALLSSRCRVYISVVSGYGCHSLTLSDDDSLYVVLEYVCSTITVNDVQIFLS